MKKMMILAACATLFSAAANAQISFAPEAGLNLANMQRKIAKAGGGTEKLDGGIKLGVKAGVNVNIPIAERLVLQPGLFYSIKGFKGETFGIDQNTTLHYAEIPVYLQYMFNDPSEGRFFVGVGPYLGIAFSGKNISGPTTDDLKFGSDSTQDLGRFDYGAGVNVGYLLRSGIFFRGQYQMGIGNLVPSEVRTDNSIRNSVFTISVGYMIGGAPKDKGPKMKGSTPM